MSIPGTLIWMGANLIPNAEAMENFPKVLEKLWETIVLSVISTTTAGYLALFFTTFGFLVRAFMETIDEASVDSVEALNATGATYFQMVFRGVIPDTLPQMMSWVFFMIDTNIRNATLVGLLTGTGIGYIFDLYYKRLDYPTVGLITVAIIVVVIAIELISNKVRRLIL
ncbi:putative membrane protein [Rhizophagus irregularis]|uniref:Putative membrane protein n=1 Tax=Rhizophagus irregularis TaxID=588596 RepID=A0A2N0QNL5_9GLOM|nr:putative membrane protein [Rhizophagus irregularis]